MLSGRGIRLALEFKMTGTRKRSDDNGSLKVPDFVGTNNLKPYVFKGFVGSLISYSPVGGGPAIQGYDASILPAVCAARSNRRTRRARTDPLACRTRPAHRHLRRSRPAV
jgi:hypothetical protein